MVDVVVMNHDVDVLDALATAIEAAGFSVAACFAQKPVEELATFVRERDARVVVYDLGPPPPEAALQKWRELCQQPGAGRRYVLTTTYPCTPDPHACIVECVLLKPNGMGDITAAVDHAIRA